MRKTETRLPVGLAAADLGEAVVAASGCALISFATAPLVVGRDNTYVVFVPDATLVNDVASFEWTFKENGEVTRLTATERADAIYEPAALGTLTVDVKVLNAANAELVTLSMDQIVTLPSTELETLIADAQNKPGPGASNPDVLRELVNEHCRYYQAATLQNAEAGDGFSRFLFSMVSTGAARRTPIERRKHLEQIAIALDEQSDDFAHLTSRGAGVCEIRLALLAMTFPHAPATPFLPWRELPDDVSQRAHADEQLCQSLASLDADTRVDLFNIARFPKSNIAACGRVIEALRDRYFGGTNFDDVLTGMSGTRAHWISAHFREGPIAR